MQHQFQKLSNLLTKKNFPVQTKAPCLLTLTNIKGIFINVNEGALVGTFLFLYCKMHGANDIKFKKYSTIQTTIPPLKPRNFRILVGFILPSGPILVI